MFKSSDFAPAGQALATSTNPAGWLLYEGPSRSDGKPVIVVATGFRNKSDNPKTGRMIQCWLFRADVPPHVAVMTGESSSVCNSCPLSPVVARKESDRLGLPKGERLPVCYVTTHFGPRAIYDGYQRGIYPWLAFEDYPSVFGGKVVRLGAYGNFSNVPHKIVRAIVRAAKGHTLYEHNWQHGRAKPLRRYAMASVSSLEEKLDAQRRGWRTFRVTRDPADIQPDEIVCPASDEAGKRTTCEKCRLCCGTTRKAKNIVITDHGPTSRVLAAKRFPLATV